MQKYTAIRKKPLNVQGCSPQAEVWRNATPETYPDYFMTGLIVVNGDDVYIKWPKHQTGVINARVSGGKWEKVNPHYVAYSRHGGGVAGWLEQVGAVHADFKGGPRL